MGLLFAYETFLRDINKFQVASVTIPDFLHFFHAARQAYFDQRLDAFELLGKMDDSLAAFYKVATVTAPGFAIDKPGDYYRMGLFVIRYQRTVGNELKTFEHKAARLTLDKEGFVLDNPYYKPSVNRWYYKQIGEAFEILGDPTLTLYQVEITYFPEVPLHILTDVAEDLQTAFKNSQLQKIAQKAATLFLENKESVRVKTQPGIQKTDSL